LQFSKKVLTSGLNKCIVKVQTNEEETKMATTYELETMMTMGVSFEELLETAGVSMEEYMED
jgi:hypothetical protein